MTISAVFEAPLSFNPTNCHALAGLELTWPSSFHCNLAKSEPALLTSIPNWFTAVLLSSFAVSARNAVSNWTSVPPEPTNSEPFLISRVEPLGNVNVFPFENVASVFNVCDEPDVNLTLANASLCTSLIATTKSVSVDVNRFPFVPKWLCNSVIPPTTVVAL